MDARPALGRTGEDLACDLYERIGFRVVDRNWRCVTGEIDVVARKGSLLVFCEVKTRSGDRFGIPAEAVSFVKQQRLRRLAAAWMSAHRPGRVDIRFDVVSVIVRQAAEAEVVHLPDAF